MDAPFRLHRPTSLLGWALHPVRWVLWRLNKPSFDRLNALLVGQGSVEQLWQLANYARGQGDTAFQMTVAHEARLNELTNLAGYTRTHADNILGLVQDAHTRCNHLQEHADNILRIARSAAEQAEVNRTAISPLAISPLMAQAITMDHVSLGRRIGMIENLLVDLQASLGESADGDVLPLPAPTQRRLVS